MIGPAPTDATCTACGEWIKAGQAMHKTTCLTCGEVQQ